MSAEFKDELASFLIEKLRDTEVFKFIQSLIRESVERIIGPNTGMNVKELSEQKLICHSMIYHYLISAGYRAAAEVMQAECYECFLSHDFLMSNVEPYDDNSVETSLGQHKLKDGITVTRATRRKSGNGIVSDIKLPAKPDPQYEQTKEKIREEIIMSASKAVERKHELMKVNEMLNDEVTDEEEDDEESKQGESETKLSTSSESTTAESETETMTSTWTKRLWSPSAHQLSTDAIIATSTEAKRAPELPPLTTTRPKPEITSIKSIDFDIPQLEKSPSTQSSDTPRNSPSPPTERNTPPKVDELSDIESIAGIDQLLESGRSDSISF